MSIGPNVVVKEGARIAHAIVQKNTIVEVGDETKHSVFLTQNRLILAFCIL